MNENAIKLAYDQASKTGFNGTIEQFADLISTNDEALNVAFEQARNTGLNEGVTIDQFSELLGIKKKSTDSESSESGFISESLGNIAERSVGSAILSPFPSLNVAYQVGKSFLDFDSDDVAKDTEKILKEREAKQMQDVRSKMESIKEDTGFDALPYITSWFDEKQFVNKETSASRSSEMEEEIQKFRDENPIGSKVVDTSFALPKEGIANPRFKTVDQSYIEEGVRFIKSKYKEKGEDDRAAVFREKVLENLPDEVKNDKQKLSELSDFFYLNFGINADLDGDGRYNSFVSNNLSNLNPVLFNAALAAEAPVSFISSLFNSAIDVTVDPALYLSSVVAGFAADGVEGSRAFSERYRAVSAPVKGGMRGLEVQTPDGFVGSIKKGNGWAAANAFANGLGSSIPSVAMAMAGPVGLAALSTGSGTQAYMEAKDDPSFSNDWQRLGWGVVSGGSDLLFGAVGRWTGATIIANAARRQATLGASKGAAFEYTKQFLTGAGYRYGVSMPIGALEEGSVAVVTTLSKAALTGEEVPANMWEMAADAAIMGAVIEPAFSSGKMLRALGQDPDLADNLQAFKATERAFAATNSNADVDNARSTAGSIIKSLVEELNTTDDEDKRNILSNQIKALESAERARRAEKIPFYNMMMVRHPDLFNEMTMIDLQIAQAAIAYKNMSDGDGKEGIKAKMNELVARRMEIEESIKGESLTMTPSEKKDYNEMKLFDRLTNMYTEINMLRSSLDLERDAEGTDLYDPQMIANMEAKLAEMEASYARATALVDQANKMFDSMESAEGTEMQGDVSIDEIKQIEQELADELGVDLEEVTRVQGLTEEQSRIEEEQKDRLRDDWMDETLEDSDNTELTQEDLEAIFNSDNFAMLTGENPNNTAASEAQNKAYNDRVKKWLKEKGLKFHEIKGRYDGKGENSFLVEGMTREQSAEFAREFRQESVAHKDGLVLGDGTINLFEGGATFDNSMTDFFSAIKDKDGNIVKFSFMPSDTYQDVNGETITEKDYGDRVEALKNTMEDIEQEAMDYLDSKETEVISSADVKEVDGVIRVPVSKSGSVGVRAGMAGLNAGEAKTLNNLVKLYRAIYGDVDVFLYDDSDNGKAEAEKLGEDWGGLFDPETKRIFINPSTIKSNAVVEGGAGIRTKSFAETVLEEVGHGIVGPSFRKLSEGDQIAIIEEIKNIIKNDPEFQRRIALKESSYAAEGITGAELREELYMEFISAMAGDKGIKLDLKQKAIQIFNRILQKVYGAVGKEFYIKDANQLHAISEALRAARKDGKTFKMDVDAPQSSRAMGSNAISPAALQPKDGELKVTFSVPFGFQTGRYSNNFGDTSYITRDVTKTFKDQWHFVNWWKKNTRMGTNTAITNFRTEDGTPIDVDRIKSWNMKASQGLETEITTTVNRYFDRIKQAERQGIIPSFIAKRMNMKLKPLSFKMNNVSPEDPGYSSFLSMARSFENHSIAMIDNMAKREGKAFNYDGDSPRMKASHALKLELIGDPNTAKSLYELKSILEDYYGAHLDNQAGVGMMLSEVAKEIYYQGKDPRGMSEEELMDIAPKVLSSVFKKMYMDGESRAAVFGGKDPVDFFEYNNNATREDLSIMYRTVDFAENQQESEVAYNIVKALTSQMSLAMNNMISASTIFYNSAEYRSRGGSEYIDPLIIKDLMNGTNKSGLDLSAVPGISSQSIARNLEKFNNMCKDYMREDGSVDFNRMLKDLNQYDGDRDSMIGRSYKAQTIFGDKIGAFALNLNGNLDAITIDSHNVKSLSSFLGLYIPTDERFEAKRQAIAEITGMDPNINTPEHNREMVARFKEIMFSKAGTSEYYTMLRMFESMMAKSPSAPKLDTKRRRLMETMIVGLAKEMGITNAQANQLVFADNQIASRGLGSNTRAYQEFSEFSEYIRENTPIWKREASSARRQLALSKYADSIEDGLNGEAVVEKNQFDFPQDVEPQMESEMMASSQLKMSFNPSVQAENSPLYRTRTQSEGLSVKPGMTISDEVVKNALNTDATSVKIMSKNNQMKAGQKVGVRLNLNVMKNTGVPVQVMHDKTASGEALKYAPVVTVRNAELFVNQSARKKILTFQENKFPMASVNGEYVSDQISESNFDGVKAFFNPFKHNVFVDAEGRPIKSAEEATMVGNTVYLRGDIEYYDFNDPILREGRSESAVERAKRTKRGDKYEKALRRFEAYSKQQLGVEYANREELEAAYDNMPITSQVALNESEIAKNAERAQMMASGALHIRRTAGRMANRYGEIRSDIMSNPENYFSKQSIQKIKDRLEMMTDADLVDIMTDDALGRLQNRNDDMAVLATSELIKRAVGRGDMDAVSALVTEAAKIGTSAGRLLRHFRELKDSTPEGLYSIVAKAIEERGNKMSKEQETKLRDITGNLFRLQAEYEDLVKRAIRGEDVEAELKDKADMINSVERELDTFTNSMIEKGWGTIGKMLIQGNLLTTMSQITNFGANMVNAIGKVGVDIVALPVEKLIGIFNGTKPSRQYSIAAYMYGAKKFGSGFIEALEEIYTGQTSDVTEWRMHRGFAPFRSLMAAFGNGDLPITQNGESVPVSQRMKLFVQGTLGIPAEVMFRLLSLGDTPFRRFVEGIEYYQAGINMGLEGDALKQFVKHPTKEARRKAEEEGRKLTYQEPTIASRAAEDMVAFMERISSKLFDWIPGVDGRAASSFLIRSTVPYVRTPANILYDTLTFVTPYVAIPRMMSEIASGDSRAAAQSFAKITIGSMVAQTAVMLVKEGLISGALDWEDDEEKNLAYDQFPPTSINISGLNRLLKGEDPSHKPDDYFISYNKLGVMGAIMGAVIKGIDKEEVRNRDYSGINLVTHTIKDSFGIGAFSSIAHMMDQSFLQGVNGLVNVVASSDADDFERNFERWFSSSFQAISATVLPNQLSAFYRMDREYLPDTRVTKDMTTAERIAKKMEYTIRDRTFGLGGVPVRVDWKGEPIKQNPRGTTPSAYQLFDITKSRQGSADPVSNEIYRLYESTEDITKAVGTPSFAETRSYNVPNISKVDMTIARNAGFEMSWMKDEEFMSKRVNLNTDQLNRMMAAAGKQRYQDLQELIASPKYAKMNDEDRVQAMNDINDNYRSGITKDRMRFKDHTIELFKIMQEIYESGSWK